MYILSNRICSQHIYNINFEKYLQNSSVKQQKLSKLCFQ
jgi:hypothetical protein